MPTLKETHAALLEALRPALLRLEPSCKEALDAHLANLQTPAAQRAKETKEPQAGHHWQPYVGGADVFEALTELRRQTKVVSELRYCTICGIVANSAYPYYFKTLEGWQKRKPECT